MDSSPDLSLKLRRGSSDSRETFYLDFAQGIDSDIELENTIEQQQPPPPPPPVESDNIIPPPQQQLYQDEQDLLPPPQQDDNVEELYEPEQPLHIQPPPENLYQSIPAEVSPVLPPTSPVLPPDSPVQQSGGSPVGDYNSENDVTIISAELSPMHSVILLDQQAAVSPPPLPPTTLPLLPRLSLSSKINAPQETPPPRHRSSHGTVSDSTTSSPSPPPTPPPPPPLSIPPPPPDPMPPCHEPHSPTLSETSISPTMPLLYHPHFQIPTHLQDNLPSLPQQNQQQQQQQQQQQSSPPLVQQVLEQNHINANAQTASVATITTVSTPDTPTQLVLSAGSSDGDTVSSVIETPIPVHAATDEEQKNSSPKQQSGVRIVDDDIDEDEDVEDEEDIDEMEEEDEEEGAEEIIPEDEDIDDYEANIEEDTMNGISHIIETHSDDINDDSSFINMPQHSPLVMDDGGTMEMPAHPPSPISPGNMLVSSETVSHISSSSPAKSSPHKHSGSHHRVTIDDSNLHLSASSTHHQLVTIATGSPSADSSHQQLTTTTVNAATIESGLDGINGGSFGGGAGGDGNGGPSTGHLALMYHSSTHHHYPILPAIRKPLRSYTDSRYSTPQHTYHEIKAGDALATTFSALYGKLLVVMGIAFPMAEVISTYIPPSFYEVYYLYLYVGSMLFLLFMYATILWGRPKIMTPMNSKKSSSKTKSKSKTKKRNSGSSSATESMEESDTESGSSEKERIRKSLQMRRPSLLAPLGGRQYHYGSFYLRMGAVAFGIGSMIYSGLEFGQYFELERDTKCHNVMLALTPATRMAFIFIQMYFIFLNNEQIKVYRHKIIARFGLMHMIGTNLSVWLNVLIQETKHEILTFYNPENRTLRISHRLGNKMQHFDHSAHLRTARGLKGPYQIFECRRTNIIGTLVQDASPFLFPCTIEYSLICAAILYVMWRSIAHPSSQINTQRNIETGHSPMKRSPHHYSVDCARAHKGLFVGILILVLTIISLILFFVLISRPEFVTLAVTEVTICELTIYVTATIATVVGMIQVRHMQYDAARSFQLDDILLVGAQTGLFLYSTFTVIGGHFTMRKDTVLVLITALASIVQTAFQTMFILDASRRQAVSPEHIRRKPGREIVTFMLVANLAMWAISTLEKSRAESHPIQLNFYGLWAWTIITHVSMPLAIFYRFHSTVCLCEIWKRAYKLKPAYM